MKNKLLAMLAKLEDSASLVKARIAALDAGESKYQGLKCVRGHDGIRYVKHNSCVCCGTQEPAVKRPYNHGIPRKSSR